MSAPDFAGQREWDIQVARVGLNPLAPTIQVCATYQGSDRRQSARQGMADLQRL